MSMAAAGARLPNCWEAVGRGTEVGRSLFALYNGFGMARNRGNEYSNRNRSKILQRLSTLGLEDLGEEVEEAPTKPKKPIVKVPHFRKKAMTLDEIPRVLLMRGRRKGSQILTQLKEELSNQELPPMPKKPLLDEKEKQRLQVIFEWSGRDVEEDETEEPMVPKKPPPPRGSVEEQEMMMVAIGEEIEERRVFLDRMYELGRGPKYEPIIRAEIQERIRQMELLDKNITLMDKERLEGRAPFSARSTIHSRASSVRSKKSVCSDSDICQTDMEDEETGSVKSFASAATEGRQSASHQSCRNGEGKGDGSEKSSTHFRKAASIVDTECRSRTASEEVQTARRDGKGSGSFKSSKLSACASMASKHSSIQSCSLRSSTESHNSHSSTRSAA